MSQEVQERKKYAAERTPRKQLQPQTDTQIVSLTEVWEQVQALGVQVQRAALPPTPKRMSRRPRLRSASVITEERQAVLADLLAQARALVPDPPDSPTRRASRESPLDEGIVKKFREQGFHL